MPRSFDSRLAFGETLAPDPSCCSDQPAGSAARDLTWGATAAGEYNEGLSDGIASPGRTIHAIVWPTGTTAPSCTLIPTRTPSAGDSISMTALSVSTSRSNSPLATLSPSFFRQE